LILALAACAERQPASSTALPKGTLVEGAATMTATVEKVDLKSRRVTLRGPDGTSQTIKVPDEVRNLPQVKKGDVVVVSYYESVAYEVRKKGTAEPGVAVASEGARAEPGQKPAAVGATAVTITATITGIDKKNGTVTVTGPDGESATVKAKNPANLDLIKTGDLVDITYSEALAIAVEPAPGK
jgi:Cu/Ag efflux protein CusF